MSALLYVTHVAPYATGPAGTHGVLGQSATAVAQLADIVGFQPRHVPDVRALDPKDIAAAGAVALFTIGETPWSDAQKQALLEALRSGRTAFLAIHAATDSCHTWEDYGKIVGARFNGHPWTQEVDLRVHEQQHPALAHLGDTWRWHDEIYQFKDLRPDARILLSVDDAELDLTTPGALRPDYGFPLSWCFTEGKGRVFSTSLGHFPHAWEHPPYMRHLQGGLEWALGEGD